MAINVCRFQPNIFVNVVNEVRANNPLCATAKYTDRLVKMLEQDEQLNEVIWDIPAVDACRKNNEAKCAAGQSTIGDNSKTLNNLVGV